MTVFIWEGNVYRGAKTKYDNGKDVRVREGRTDIREEKRLG